MASRGALGWWSRRRAARRRSPVPPTPFVVGATRSGTTMLRLMLDAHPELAIPSETHFVPELIEACEERDAGPQRLVELLTAHRRWGDFGLEAGELRVGFEALDPLTGPEAVRAFYRLYAERHGKSRWGDKTPGYIKRMRVIQEHLPEARFIHLIRDGRDVALSVLARSFGPQTVEAAAERWRERIERARAQAPYLAHYTEVKFEDLVLDTEGTLRRICELIELPWDDAMLAYHERAAERLREKARDLPRGFGRAPQPAESRLESHRRTSEPPNPELLGAWKRKMAPEDRATYEAIAGDLLADLGYEVEHPDRIPRRRRRRRSRLPVPLRRAAGLASRAIGPRRSAAGCPPAPFVVGMARSGTELVAAMLDAHPEVALARETMFLPALAEAIEEGETDPERLVKIVAAHRALDELGLEEEGLASRLRGAEADGSAIARAIYGAIATQAGKPRWGDETPAYLKRMRRIQRAVPEARFVHVIRDGRDVAAARPGETPEPGRVVTIAERWRRKLETAREDAPHLSHYLEVRYENLIAEPGAEMRRICHFLELPFVESMLAVPRQERIEAELGSPGSWRERLGPEGRDAFEEVAGGLLAELGYESHLRAPSAP